MNNIIHRYVKDKQGNRIGLLVGSVGERGSAEVLIGWSRCRVGDDFDFEFGMSQALTTNMGQPIPPSFEKEAKEFRVQCFRYFKNAYHIQQTKIMDYAKQPPSVRPRKIHHNGGHRAGCSYERSGYCICYTLAGGSEDQMASKRVPGFVLASDPS